MTGSRKTIKIDADKCDGCGLCVDACHEGAIGLVDGKAVLLREDYCDGLGDCLPVCPTAAITFSDCPSDESPRESETLPCGCPGTQSREFDREKPEEVKAPYNAKPLRAEERVSRLRQWPVQIKLVPVNAAYFKGARLLVAADCAAYAYADFHEVYMRNSVTLIGCPKLDEGDYSEKLTEILKNNDIKSVTVARMEVPCCGGIENAAVTALKNCGKMIPWQVVVISTDGRILDA